MATAGGSHTVAARTATRAAVATSAPWSHAVATSAAGRHAVAIFAARRPVPITWESFAADSRGFVAAATRGTIVASVPVAE
ncbi:UNVERIFIED_CONTAM: hypothetical protein FKN15_048025 [Acipenser sinensis]